VPAESFDTIVVGARCAGAPLAIHLARAGQRVLLLDGAKLPSDQPMSTHVVSPLGVEWLDELGVGAAVRRASPPIFGTRLDLAGSPLDVPFQRRRPGHGLRRLHLDRLLQEAAAGAGADLRDQTKVVGLIREGDRVVGVEAVRDGVQRQHRARLVVGADGRHSSVAELAGAEEYLGYDNPRFYYWAYWPATPAWTDELRSLGAYFEFDPDSKIRMVFQTDGGLLLIGVAPLQTELSSWKGRFEEAYLEALRASPVIAPIIEGNAREGKLLGLQKSRFFFRAAAGPGFALVGDAGLHKDPLPGFGITDALRDARNLGRAVLAGSDDALARYWRQRDVDSIDLFHFAHDMADPSYVNPLNQLVFARARRSPELLARASAQADREISPYAVVPVGTVLRIVAGAVLRGSLSVVPAFLAAGKRGARAARARRERVEALASLGPPAAKP
jgi:flavin-dependent dehydrogenase